ncbi:hypothetical protein ACFLYR_07550 [Chloroflexota bacterium]
MERTRGYYNTFVVKIWRDEGILRGHIQHVGTQEHSYFLSLENLRDFIVNRLGPPASGVRMPDRMQDNWALVGEELGDIGSDE